MQKSTTVFHNLPPTPGTPVVLTLGSFDGVHWGHQQLLQRLKQVAKDSGCQTAVITFSNHPSAVLRPESPKKYLCTIEHKVQLLKEEKIDSIFLLPFTKEFSEQSPEVFLNNLQRCFHIKKLVLGSDAHLGKDRQGNRSTVEAIAKSLGFEVEYFPDFLLNGKRISSSQIRECIVQGALEQAKTLLHRPYSIYSKVTKGNGRGNSLGFATANISVEGLCIPSLGVYAVDLKCDGKIFQGVANLGVAPTIKSEKNPVLEVHLYDQQINLYDKWVNIHFKAYLRPEKRFGSVEELKSQIKADITSARKIHLS